MEHSLKEMNNRKAGCSQANWKPNGKEDILESKILVNTIGSDHPKFFDLLEDTYAAQREFLTNPTPPTILEIRKEWPVLFIKEAIYWHFKKLTQKDLPKHDEKILKIVTFGRHKNIPVSETDELILQALKVLAYHFKETFRSFFYEFPVRDIKV